MSAPTIQQRNMAASQPYSTGKRAPFVIESPESSTELLAYGLSLSSRFVIAQDSCLNWNSNISSTSRSRSLLLPKKRRPLTSKKKSQVSQTQRLAPSANTQILRCRSATIPAAANRMVFQMKALLHNVLRLEALKSFKFQAERMRGCSCPYPIDTFQPYVPIILT